jgi:predicted secreted protein
MKYQVFFISLIFVFLSCCAMKKVNQPLVSFTDDQKEAAVTVKTGDTLAVKMSVISGTGYVWLVAGTPVLCKMADSRTEQVTKGMMGGAAKQVISFIITAKGKEDIIFNYMRPFEKNKPPAQTKVLHLSVN